MVKEKSKGGLSKIRWCVIILLIISIGLVIGLILYLLFKN